MFLHVKLSDTQDNSATNIPANTILFGWLKSSENVTQNLITVTRYLFKPLKILSKGKGKAIPLQAWTDLEGSRRLRFPDFKTIST